MAKSLQTQLPRPGVSSQPVYAFNRPQVANTSGVICRIKASALGSRLVSHNPSSNTSVLLAEQVQTEVSGCMRGGAVAHCVIVAQARMPFSICELYSSRAGSSRGRLPYRPAPYQAPVLIK